MYTQNTDKLLKAVSDAVNNIEYDSTLAKSCVVSLVPEANKTLFAKEDLPPLWQLILLDCLVAKVEVSLDEVSESDTTTVAASERSCVQDLVPNVIKLTKSILHCTRWSMFHLVVDQNENTDKVSV